jgi:RNA polymerase sigma factor (sigma-70 family)
MARASSPRASDFLTVDDDAALVQRAAAGEVAAFEELYRRHSQAAWRVAQAVAPNRDDAADAVAEAFTRVLASLPTGRLAEGAPFRPYLLAATRNAAIDIIRRTSRTRPTDDDGLLDAESDRPETPADRILAGDDADVVVRAFRDLPERWRSVLWLTEVEGIPAREVAPLLGLTANGTAQLAVRARAGLRERYLQAHVRNHARPECVFAVDRLGAYVGGALATRDTAKVDQHLAACDDCRDRLAELEDITPRLRRAVLPIPIGLAGAAVGHWQFWSASTSAKAAAALFRRSAGFVNPQRAIAIASASLLALGVVSTLQVQRGLDRAHDQALERGRPDLAPPAASVLGSDAQRHAPVFGEAAATNGGAISALGERARAGSDAPVTIDDGVTASVQPGANGAGGSAGGSGGGSGGGAGGSGPSATVPTSATPTVQVSAGISVAAPLVVVVSAGAGDGSCSGVSIAGQGGGCTPPAPTSSPGIAVSAGGQGVPPVNVTLP